MNIRITELTDSRDSVNKWMERYGVRFGVYKNGVFNEQLFPFDPVPRIIGKDDWAYLEQGLKQRVQALNKFLWDVYHEKKIIKDGIVPEEFVYSSKGYMPECEQINPTGGVYAHIAGIDLVEGKNGQWYVLEDNLRIPSGASYPMIARQITRRVAPSTFASHTIAENRGYADLLRGMMDEMNDGRGISVILTPGRYNSAYFEHSYLAEKTGATLAYPGDLFVEDNKVYYSGIYKERTRVGCIYRRVSDEYMDPLVFEASSLLGIPNVMQAYKAGNVALVNAIGNGVADDKGIYYFVPKMVEYYLDEKPILQNAPTYLPYFKEDYDYVLSNIQRLVIKDVSEAGGYGVVFGKDLSEEKLEELKTLIISQPRRWIAQEVIDFKDLKVLDDTDSSSSVDGTAGVCQSVSEGMKRYLYNYQTIVTFSEPVSAHAVMLRCQPAANAFQTIEQEHIIVSPDYWMNAGTDAFSNRILFGGASEPHTVFAYVSTGIVATETYFQKQRGENMFLYSQPSQLTQLNDAMREAALTDAGATTAEKARQLCHRVYEMMAYEPETTTVETPAEDAFSRQCGVCQDYAHLMIAFCRANGLPARYVNGFLEGTGQTHAWVEVFDGYSWQGYDPTHDRTLLQQGYVKIAHGRDSADCPVSRGMFRGQAVQQTQISVTLQEL